MQQLKIYVFVFAFFMASSAFAQSQQQLTKIKERLKTELSIDDAKADSVMTIVQEFYTDARSIRTSTTMKEEEKKTALKNTRLEEMTRLRSHLSKEQLRKLQGVVQEYKMDKQNKKSAQDSTSTE